MASAPSVGRYLLCSVGMRVCALQLTHVRETMRPLPRAPLDDVPANAPLLQHGIGGALAALTTLDQQLLLVLQTARLVPDSVWHSMHAREQSV